MQTPITPANFYIPFTDKIDLACEDVGGRVIQASDDFFAEKENLLKADSPVFIADKYTERGKWMDGWESRRKRTPGHDHCIVRLGLPGRIHGFDIDTAFFTGNFPEYAAIEALEAANPDATAEDLARDNPGWVTIVPKTRLQGGSHNIVPIAHNEHAARRFTHLRLRIYPDGGVARLRVFGDVMPDWKALQKSLDGASKAVDVAAAANGATVIASSDSYFGPKDNLIKPGRAKTMGGGWETRRRRGAGHDWIVVRLGCTSIIDKIEIDTHHFKGNFPDTCSMEVCRYPARDLLPCDLRDRDDLKWTEILPRTKLAADTAHEFSASQLKSTKEPVDYIRLNIFPDGGVSRLRIWGRPAQ
jgi:allantoicase